MVLGYILRYLANNEQLVQRLSESYPMRRAAQIAVSIFYRSKSVAEEHGLQNLTPERFRAFFRSFNNNLKKEIEGAKDEIKKRK